jgi:hypothetical protein
MKRKILLIFCILATMLLLAAGCSQPVVQPATPTPTQTQEPGTSVATPGETIGPEVTTPPYIEGPIPSQYEVTVQVDRNTVATDPTITIEFRGGKGINFVSTLDVMVITSDGRVLQESLYKPQVNDKVVMQGSMGTDRVQVFVTLVTGDRYMIKDEEHSFRRYN